MERFAEIRITKSILLIPERILWKYLPADEITEGIKRGKGYKRVLACERRQNKEKEMKTNGR